MRITYIVVSNDEVPILVVVAFLVRFMVSRFAAGEMRTLLFPEGVVTAAANAQRGWRIQLEARGSNFSMDQVAWRGVASEQVRDIQDASTLRARDGDEGNVVSATMLGDVTAQGQVGGLALRSRHRASQISNAKVLRTGSIKPSLLLRRLQGGELGVMAPRQILPTSGDVELLGDIRHVHQRLLVVARRGGGKLVSLAVACEAEPNPVAEPPVRALGDHAEA